MQAQHEKRKALRDKNREVRKATMEQHKAETLSTLKDVLNETQLAAFNARMEAKKQKHHRRMKEE